MSKGRRSSRVYAFRAGSEKWAFVPHPLVADWWFRTDLSVLVVRCAEEGCGAEPGVPCRSNGVYRGGTHWKRRRDARDRVQNLDYAMGIVAMIPPIGKAAHA